MSPTTEQRYCIVSDGDTRRYICPVERREEASAALEAIMEYWEGGYEDGGPQPPMPDFLVEVGVHNFTFSNPRQGRAA